jgi:cardiolipin synthase A/B
VNELFDASLPWWGWALMLTGLVGLVSVVGALFLPDWKQPDYALGPTAPPGTEAFAVDAASALGVPLYRGGQATVLQNGDAFFPDMLEAIRGARDSVNFEVYIFEPDELGRRFMDAFIDRARAGVEVRLLVDWFGSWKLRKRHVEELTGAGVRVECFRPLALRHLIRIYRRTHRRAIVIDGRIGFTGGAAVSQKWAGDVRTKHEWRDSMTRVTGPLVCGIQAAFVENWLYCTGEVLAGDRFFPPTETKPGLCAVSVASSPSEAQQPVRLLFWMSFAGARRRLWISNSYFIPDLRLRDAVVERARQGVDVRILVPGNHTDAVPVQLAGRSYYEELLGAGVRIYEFQPSMMHAKTIVVDDAWSVVGSANMDERSMELNAENVLGIADESVARAIAGGLEQDFTRSREVQLEQWRRRPIWQRGLEHLAKVLIEQY